MVRYTYRRRGYRALALVGNKSSHHGFTIVELLIVIVVIAILAAISVVAYEGVQERARTVVVQSDLRNLGQKIQEYYVLNGQYPTGKDQLATLNWKISNENSYQLKSGGNMLYCAIVSGDNARFVVAARTAGNTAFTYSSTNGLRPYTGIYTGMQGTDCPQHNIPTTETGFGASQGYHPQGWGTPGWNTWTGGSPAMGS